MIKEELEKYIGELSPEMQEKARECKTMDELNALLAENDAELSEDALEAVAGGCSVSNKYETGAPMPYRCPECNEFLRYWDNTLRQEERMYCDNPKCTSYNNGLWFCAASGRLCKAPQ